MSKKDDIVLRRNEDPIKEKTVGAAKDILLITGIGGFLGLSLSKALAQDYCVVGLDRESDCAKYPDCIPCDLTSDSSVGKAMDTLRKRFGKRFISVIHLSGYYDFTGEPNPLYEEVNVKGTRRLLQALQDFEIEQFIYASTMLVHAPTEPGVPITEDWPLQPKWAYPQSKLETEHVVQNEHGAIHYVLPRIAGVYTDHVQPPTLAHQIQRIYERQFTSRVFAGDISHGQAFIHIDDLIDAVVCIVRRRNELPAETPLLLGEPSTMGYEALQNELGFLIHGETWATETLPKMFAKVGAHLQEHMEIVIPDSIDKGEKPFIKPFMVDLADDHYELDISRARQLLDWEPKHSLRDALPSIIKELKTDPLGWYKRNRLTPPEWVETMIAQTESADHFIEAYNQSLRDERRQNLWAHFLNMSMGTWLMTSPPILGYQDRAMIINDLASGALVFLFGALSLSPRMAWARIANAAVGLWLLFAPLVFWTPSASAYLNDTLAGFLVIGFAILSRPMPGIGLVARMAGPDVPPGWDYCPSSWTQRIPIIFLAFIGFYISRYLAAYQLGHIGNVWDPYFGDGTERIITSDISKAWPVPDAGLGAVTYALEILTGIIGGRDRWRTMPWLVVLFGVMIVPLGIVSIFFIIIQPILIGTWCTLCLIAAAAMLIQIPYSVDELVATGQFLAERRRKGKSVILAFLRGDTMEGGRKMEAENFEKSPWTVLKDMLGGGVNVPWSLVLSMAIGVWLMCTRLIFATQGEQANSDHLIGALVITVAITALAESARPARFINILLAIPLMTAPWMLDGGSLGADWAGLVAGLLLILLSIPRGKIENRYGDWSRYLV
ncbi:MAG: NAD-dependent epimerase/dehydratase family protein [Methylobacter sp.]|uniref:NAD-dependent epimerase/dehydratase family protein n=1 Tax=Methylobacter sp. TaxID=2051955 RepID=UPI00273226E2|nr:NAD-dependent epimerase/dehydratase family protein [Methylobacter sp.]MDP1664724.1 NAD-dependent epimerase/dehydratase family protein [Methylobacter sp.]MDP1970131.1 NAD-dependent epimerase/dehydratase family protein [Methylobacter sp.]